MKETTVYNLKPLARIKKTTAILMMVVAFLAVFGVVCVSFAAWQGNKTVLQAQGTTGSVHMFGFRDETVISPIENVLPWDYPSNDGSDNIVTVALPEYTVYGGTYHVTVSADSDKGYYVYVGEAKADIPENWSDTNAGLWKKASGGAMFTFNAPEQNADGEYSVSNMNLYILFAPASSNYMNTTVTFTVNLSYGG